MVKKESEGSFDASPLVSTEQSSLSDILTKAPRKSWRPKIHKLADAIVDGKFVVPVGERVIIQYPEDAFRDTTLWVVCEVFEDVPDDTMTISPGHIRLWDPEKTQHGATNYKEANRHGLVMKIPDKSRRWTPGEEETLMELAKKHRRRKKKQFIKDDSETPTPPRVPSNEPTAPVPKKKGRPKGSKNKATLEREAAKKSAA